MRKYLGYVIGIVIFSFGAIGFTYSLTVLVDISDIQQAIADIVLELSVTFSLLVMLFGIGWVMHKWSRNNQSKSQWANFWQGISTEMYGAVITGFTLGMVVLVFQQYSAIQNHKAELILQMGSPDNGFAIEATRQIVSLGWHEDGTLIEADLRSANLSGAWLGNANLTEADLRSVNLTEADLRGVNLSGTNLWSVNLTNAVLWSANLSGA